MVLSTSGVALAARRTRQHLAEPLFRSAYALILAELLASGLGIVFWSAAARLYATEDVGRASATIAAMLTLANLANLNLPMGLLRFLPTAGERGPAFVRRAYAVTAGAGAVLAAGFVLVAPGVSGGLAFLRGSTATAVTVVVGVALWCVFALQDAVLTAVRRAHWVPVESGLFGLVKIALLVVLAGTAGGDGIVLAWLVAMALAVPPVNAYLFARALPRHAAERGGGRPLAVRDVARFVGADYAGVLLVHLSTTALPLLVLSLLGAAANALFFVAWTIGASLLRVAANVGYSLTVEGAFDERLLAEHGRRALGRCLQLVGLGAVVVLVAAPWLLAVFGPDYRDAAVLLRLLAVSAVPASVNLVSLALLRVRRRLARIVTLQGVQCAAMLGLTLLAAPRAGLAGVGAAWLVTQLVLCAVNLPDLRGLLAGTRRETRRERAAAR